MSHLAPAPGEIWRERVDQCDRAIAGRVTFALFAVFAERLAARLLQANCDL
jgi:hypothetical protein